MTPEARARQTIDALLAKAGWNVCDPEQVDLSGPLGVAIREFPLAAGHGFADYLLYVGGRAAGVIEAKPEGATLTGVEVQSGRYATGLPEGLPAWRRPLPFTYESTGAETHFTNGLDPEPRARGVFAFHRPETLRGWLSPPPGGWASDGERLQVAEAPASYQADTFLARVRAMPELVTQWGEHTLWPAQVTAIRNLEKSLAQGRRRALIQMATGSGKTFTAISFIYRLIKYAGARRVLFLVDRGNLGRQTKKEFDQYLSPANSFKFGEEYIVQHLTSNTLDGSARVVISTIQRMYSMLKGRELAPEDDEVPVGAASAALFPPEPIDYNPAIPIETFDIIVTDEAHRSIYNLWRQVLEYFDASLIGLTATPSKQTFGFFNQNLVMEYGHEQAVADGVNVNYDVYRIRTAVSEAGSTVDAGYFLGYRDKLTRKVRWEQLDEEFAYDPEQLDRSVQTPDQIRTLIRTFRDKLPEIYPGRSHTPKTLIFAKDDNHAETIVEIVREEFGKGNEFAQKITYRTTGETPERLIAAFRNSYHPRIAVTVDMIATGTDIKPLEIVMFMRAVKSRTFFEQMKGRGVRVINPADLQSVTPDARAKDHFVIVDCVGVCERDLTDSRPMDQRKSVPLDKLLQALALGNTEPEVLSSVAARLARLEKDLPAEAQARITQAAGGLTLRALARQLVDALNPDLPTPSSPSAGERIGEGAVHPPAPVGEGIGEGAVHPPPLVGEGRSECAVHPSPPGRGTEGEGHSTDAALAAIKPFSNPALRELILTLKKQAEQVIDDVTQDQVLEASFSEAARERARTIVGSFEAFIQQHKDEITALQILYNRPTRAPLKYDDLKSLADALHAPPHLISESALWQAYAALDQSKVKGASTRRILTDLVSLVRYAMHQDNELVPYPEKVMANFRAWLAQQESARPAAGPPVGPAAVPGARSAVGPASAGQTRFTPEQRWWLEKMAEHIASNLGLEAEDFELPPFNQRGGLGKVHQLFGAELSKVIEEMNRECAA